MSAKSAAGSQLPVIARALAGTVQEKLEVDLEVKVLTTGFWPTYTAAELSLPAEMAACVSSFQTFYSDTTKNRKLLWVHNLVRARRRGSQTSRTRLAALSITSPISAAMLQTVLRTPADSGLRRSTAKRKRPPTRSTCRGT